MSTDSRDDVAALCGLTGSPRVVYEEAARLIESGNGEAISVSQMSRLTNYSYATAQRALRQLREMGLLKLVEQAGPKSVYGFPGGHNAS